MLVKDAMRVDTEDTIGPQATLHEAAEMMCRLHIDALPIVEKNRLVGVIRLTDLITAPIPAQFVAQLSENRTEQQVIDVWSTMLVGNLMNDQILTVAEDTPLLKAVALMVNNGKQRLLVLRAGQVVGMIAREDVVRALLRFERDCVSG